jgi:hypothetical protein
MIAFIAVAVRVEPDVLPDYTAAAINLRPDLAPAITANAVRTACRTLGAMEGPRSAFSRDNLGSRQVELCQVVNQIVKAAVTAAPNAVAQIAAAAVLACPDMRQCILEGALAANPSAEKEIFEAVMEVSLPETALMVGMPGDYQLTPVVSPEKPPDD